MIGEEDVVYIYEYDDYYKIILVIYNWLSDLVCIKNGKKVLDGFNYFLDNNKEWMNFEELKSWIEVNVVKIGKF